MSFENPKRVTEYLIGFDNSRFCRKEDRDAFEAREKPTACVVASSWRAALGLAVMPPGCARKHIVSVCTTMDFGFA